MVHLLLPFPNRSESSFRRCTLYPYFRCINAKSNQIQPSALSWCAVPMFVEHLLLCVFRGGLHLFYLPIAMIFKTSSLPTGQDLRSFSFHNMLHLQGKYRKCILITLVRVRSVTSLALQFRAPSPR